MSSWALQTLRGPALRTRPGNLSEDAIPDPQDCPPLLSLCLQA